MFNNLHKEKYGSIFTKNNIESHVALVLLVMALDVIVNVAAAYSNCLVVYNM